MNVRDHRRLSPHATTRADAELARQQRLRGVFHQIKLYGSGLALEHSGA
jgi:hypothetical protein